MGSETPEVGLAGRLTRLVRRVDAGQQRHRATAVPVAVVRKFGEDRAGSLAALLSYYGFFSLFPLLAVATTILGRVLEDDPDLHRRVLDTALANLPLIGPQISGDLRGLDAGGIGLAIAIGLSLWSGLGAIKAFEHAMNTVWNVPGRRRPGFVTTNLRALMLLGGLGLLILVSSLAAMTSILGTGWAGTALTLAVSLVLHAGLFLGAYTLLTATSDPWRHHVPGAIAAALAWTLVLRIGGVLVAHQIASANALFGTFALVVGLLAWLYLAATIALYGAEINVVLASRLWPRSLIQPPLTEADRRALLRYAYQGERRPEVEVHAHVDRR